MNVSKERKTKEEDKVYSNSRLYLKRQLSRIILSDVGIIKHPGRVVPLYLLCRRDSGSTICSDEFLTIKAFENDSKIGINTGGY